MAARKNAKKAAKKRGSVKKAASAKARTVAAKKKKTPARKAAKKKTPARKAKATPARKPVTAKKKAPARKKKQTVGEGDYEASRAFLKDQSDFVAENRDKIPGLGRKARAALEGSEGPSLLAAEAEARSHSKTGSEE